MIEAPVDQKGITQALENTLQQLHTGQGRIIAAEYVKRPDTTDSNAPADKRRLVETIFLMVESQ